MKNQLVTVGWREWLSLPELGLTHIKAKVDTGAKTSCLHAFEVDPYTENGVEMVRFLMHPVQKNTEIVQECRTRIIDQRQVSDSGGHQELRYVIETRLDLGEHAWNIEVTLTNRDTMAFRMLLGRSAMEGRLLVNPQKSFLLGNQPE
ncbi:MAG: ATP-dependent zinc protease [Thioalkalispiraceae bacterium]|jgi:hypothetical protein